MATQRGPDGSIRWSIGGTISGVPWACVHWADSGNATGSDTIDLGNFLSAATAAWIADLGAHMAVSAVFAESQATHFWGGTSVTKVTHPLTGNGTANGVAVSDASCCSIVSWNTSVYWRGGKPRTYIPLPITTDVLNINQLTAAAQSALQASATSFHNAINAINVSNLGPIVHGFVSFHSGKQPRVPPVFFPIQGATVHPRLGSQRRRLGRWTA
jgi:hypothetical protein